MLISSINTPPSKLSITKHPHDKGVPTDANTIDTNITRPVAILLTSDTLTSQLARNFVLYAINQQSPTSNETIIIKRASQWISNIINIKKHTIFVFNTDIQKFLAYTLFAYQYR